MLPNILFPFQSNGIFSGAPTFSHSPPLLFPLWTTFSHRSHSFLSRLIQRVVPGRGIVVPELRRDETTGTSIGHARHRKTTVLTVTSTRIRREGLRPRSTVERCTRPNPPPVVATTQLLSRSRSPLSPLRHVSGDLSINPGGQRRCPFCLTELNQVQDHLICSSQLLLTRACCFPMYVSQLHSLHGFKLVGNCSVLSRTHASKQNARPSQLKITGASVLKKKTHFSTYPLLSTNHNSYPFNYFILFSLLN